MATKKNNKQTKEIIDKVKKTTPKQDTPIGKPTSVYNADYSLIDNSIEEIKKASRRVSTNSYSTNNVYIILQDALKKVLNAEK